MRQTVGVKNALRFLAFLLALFFLVTIAGAGCNALLDNADHELAAGDAAQDGPASGASSGSSGNAADGGAFSDAAGDSSIGSSSGTDSGLGSSGGTDSGVGSSGETDSSAASDGAGDAGAGADASSCDPRTPFSSIKIVGGLPVGTEIHGRLSPDEMTIWFDTNAGTIYVGVRQSLAAPFSYEGLAADAAYSAFVYRERDIYPTVLG